jgi:hypothetical protein
MRIMVGSLALRSGSVIQQGIEVAHHTTVAQGRQIPQGVENVAANRVVADVEGEGGIDTFATPETLTGTKLPGGSRALRIRPRQLSYRASDGGREGFRSPSR